MTNDRNLLDLETKTWVVKYSPTCIEEVILPMRIKKFLQKFADTKDIQSYTAVGVPGCGKTSSARALIKEVGCEHIVINASKDGNIETIRQKVVDYATKFSLRSKEVGYKVIILDEADGLSLKAQEALRGVIEDYQETCRFILTANNPNKISEALFSRCPLFDFNFTAEEKTEMKKQFIPRVRTILKENKVTYDPAELLGFINRYFPNIRTILHLLSRNIVDGVLELTGVGAISEEKIGELIKILRSGDFNNVLKWAAESMDTEPYMIRRAIYDRMNQIIEREDIPSLVLILNEYDFKEASVMDNEINMVAMLATIMGEVKFK